MTTDPSRMLYRRSDRLMEAAIDDAIVALDRDAGICLDFNSTAAAIWRLLESPRTVSGIVERLQTEYDVEGSACRDDVLALLAELGARGLVTSELAD